MGLHERLSSLDITKQVDQHLSIFSTEGESRGLREKRGSRGRARKGSDEDSPKKKKMKNRYPWVGGLVDYTFLSDLKILYC